MKAKRKSKPAKLVRLTTYATMSDGRKFTILDINIDTLTIYGQLYGSAPAELGKIPNRTGVK